MCTFLIYLEWWSRYFSSRMAAMVTQDPISIRYPNFGLSWWTAYKDKTVTWSIIWWIRVPISQFSTTIYFCVCSKWIPNLKTTWRFHIFPITRPVESNLYMPIDFEVHVNPATIRAFLPLRDQISVPSFSIWLYLQIEWYPYKQESRAMNLSSC